MDENLKYLKSMRLEEVLTVDEIIDSFKGAEVDLREDYGYVACWSDSFDHPDNGPYRHAFYSARENDINDMLGVFFHRYC